MEITTKNEQARVPVTIMMLDGQLDGSNYQNVIKSVKEVYASGARHLLMDLSNLSHISSAGIVAIHNSILIMRGGEPLDPEMGWSTIRSIGDDVDRTTEKNLKILNPQPTVDRSLELTGFKSFLEIYTDEEEALDSF